MYLVNWYYLGNGARLQWCRYNEILVRNHVLCGMAPIQLTLSNLEGHSAV